MSKPNSPKVESLDLRGITRDSAHLRTKVTLEFEYKSKVDPWIIFGEAKFNTELKDGAVVIGGLFNKGTTDPCHDSAYAIRFQVIGLTFKHLWYHTATFQAWIDPNDPDAFRVPAPGYNPAKIKGIKKCTDGMCRERHIILPDGFYVPPFNPTLWEVVRGCRVEISVGPATLEG